jgi:cyclohexanecarboxyl-CoA dehydrogenase
MFNSLIGEIITQHTSEELKRTWLPSLAKGKKVLGIAITEPKAGSDG